MVASAELELCARVAHAGIVVLMGEVRSGREYHDLDLVWRLVDRFDSFFEPDEEPHPADTEMVLDVMRVLAVRDGGRPTAKFDDSQVYFADLERLITDLTGGQDCPFTLIELGRLKGFFNELATQARRHREIYYAAVPA